MRHQETSLDGSFTAWGASFCYNFDASVSELNIHVQEGDAPLVVLAVGNRLRRRIQPFIHYFDKAAQIKALMLSNSATINIGQTLEPQRLRGIANTLFDHALFALDMNAGKTRRFTATMAHTCDLKHFSIKQLVCPSSPEAIYYRASLKTHKGNELVGRSLTLSGILMTVSEKIISDLIALEFSSRDDSAQNLLALSAKLSTIGRILNDGFYPSMKIRQPDVAESAGISTHS